MSFKVKAKIVTMVSESPYFVDLLSLHGDFISSHSPIFSEPSGHPWWLALLLLNYCTQAFCLWAFALASLSAWNSAWSVFTLPTSLYSNDRPTLKNPCRIINYCPVLLNPIFPIYFSISCGRIRCDSPFSPWAYLTAPILFPMKYLWWCTWV